MNNQWNSDVITPEGEAGSTPIATNGGLDVNTSGELEVKVDGSTIDINSSGELEAIGGGAVYEAGEGIVINGSTISADETVLATKAELGSYATTESMTTGLSAKQDTISDLDTIRSGAQAGASAVQPSGLAPYATTASMNTALAGKQDVISDLSTIRSGAEAGATALQPGALDDYVTDSDLSTALSSKQDTISDLGTIRAGAAAGASAVQPGSLATVATTGSYNDLSNKPVIPPGVVVDQTYDGTSANAQSGTAVAGAIATKQDTISDLSTIRSGASAGATAVQPGDLATVATTGAYSDLSGTPDLSGYATTSAMNTALAGKQDTISDLSTIRSGAAAGATAVQPSSLATVATTGDYDDLANKPTIPVVPSTKPVVAGSNITITDGANNVTIAATDTTYTAGTGLTLSSGAFSVDTSVVATQSDLSSYTPTASLATVATTGDYGDLSNRPTIPTVDQSYNASSTNAQSGAAVASALAGLTIPVIGTVTIPDPTPDPTPEPEPSVETCSYCGGSGVDPNHQEGAMCMSCNGLGYIEQPMMCGTCGGTGTIMDGQETCPDCGGSGWMPGGDTVPCAECGGTGYYSSDATCPVCSGSGTVQASESPSEPSEPSEPVLPDDVEIEEE